VYESRSWQGVLDRTLCDKVCHWLVTGQWYSMISSTNKTEFHDITEILLKVASNIITLTPCYSYLAQFSDNDCTWWRLFQKRALHIKLDICVYTYKYLNLLFSNKTLIFQVKWLCTLNQTIFLCKIKERDQVYFKIFPLR
jgi:hypothetical protein